jgi:hypothetical protein
MNIQSAQRIGQDLVWQHDSGQHESNGEHNATSQGYEIAVDSTSVFDPSVFDSSIF